MDVYFSNLEALILPLLHLVTYLEFHRYDNEHQPNRALNSHLMLVYLVHLLQFNLASCIERRVLGLQLVEVAIAEWGV